MYLTDNDLLQWQTSKEILPWRVFLGFVFVTVVKKSDDRCG